MHLQNIDFSTDFESCRRVASEKAAIIEQEEIAKRLAHEEAKREELRVQREIALEKQKKCELLAFEAFIKRFFCQRKSAWRSWKPLIYKIWITVYCRCFRIFQINRSVL
jgi:hypothetical protein